MHFFLPPPVMPLYLQFNETMNRGRAKIVRRLITNRARDEPYTTVRLGFRKCDIFDPAPPKGANIQLILGDDKANSSNLTGQATIVRCSKTIWRYFNIKRPNNPDFWNNLDGSNPQTVEYWILKYYNYYHGNVPGGTPINKINPDQKISMITFVI